ncbi:MAG TPA: MFS transporter, partial [Anaerolineae bacterium]|nr:MFS transporter [Anaerolineae bacterium]
MDHFPYGKAFLFSTGFLGINVIWALFNNFVPTHLAGLGLSATLIGFVMTWDNYLNMFIQPIVGNWSDRTHTRIGRRKPWLMAGAPLAAIFFVFIPLEQSLYFIMGAILLTNFGMTLFRSPTVALLGDLFTPEERSIAGAILDLMGGVGVIVALTGGWLLFARFNFGLVITFAFGSLVLLATILLILLRLNEPKVNLIDEKQGPK